MHHRWLGVLLAVVAWTQAVALELPRAFTAGSLAPAAGETIRQIVPTLDGGYFLIGERPQAASLFYTPELSPHTFVRRVSRNLATRWDRTYFGARGGVFVPAGDGGWLASSQIRMSGLFGFEVLRLDANGNVVAEVTRFRSDGTAAGEWRGSGLSYPVTATVGNDILVGTTVTVSTLTGTATDIAIMRVRPDGSVAWSRRAGLTGNTRLSAMASGEGVFAAVDREGSTTNTRTLYRLNPDSGALSVFRAAYSIPRGGTSPKMLTLADRLVVLEETTNSSRIRPILSGLRLSNGTLTGALLMPGTSPVELKTRRGRIFAVSRDATSSALRISDGDLFSNAQVTTVPGSATDLALGPLALTNEWLAIAAVETGRVALRVYTGQPSTLVGLTSAPIPSGNRVLTWRVAASMGRPVVAASTQPTSPTGATVSGFSGSAPLTGLANSFTAAAGSPREIAASDIGKTGTSDGAGGFTAVGSSHGYRGLFARFDSAGTATSIAVIPFETQVLSGGLDFVFRLSTGDYYLSGEYQVRSGLNLVTRRALMRVGPTGTVVWRRAVDAAPGRMASAKAVTVERDGSIWLLGRGRTANEIAAMRKYDRNGALQRELGLATADAGGVLDVIVLADGRFLALRQISEPGLVRARLDLVPATGGEPIGTVFVNGVGSRTLPFAMIRNGSDVFVLSSTNFRGFTQVADVRTTPISLVSFSARPSLTLFTAVENPTLLRVNGNRASVRVYSAAERRHRYGIVNVSPGSGLLGTTVFVSGVAENTLSAFVPWTDTHSLLAYTPVSVPTNATVMPALTATLRNGATLLATASTPTPVPGLAMFASDIVPVSATEAWVVGSQTTRLGGDELAVWRVRR